MSMKRGQDGFLARGGNLQGAPFVNGALSAGALVGNIDGNGGNLLGVVMTGDTFTIAGETGSPVHTVGSVMPTGANLTPTPEDLTAGGWNTGGTGTRTAAVAVHAGHSFCRVVDSGSYQIAIQVLLGTDGTKYYAILVHTDGTDGTFQAGLHDDIAMVFRGEATITVSSGVATAVATMGALIGVTSLGDGVYHVAVACPSCVAAHAHSAYAFSTGTIASVLVTNITVKAIDTTAISVYPTVAHGILGLTFTTAIASGGAADNAVITFAANSVSQVTAWTLTTTQETLESTVMGNPYRTYVGGIGSWSGTIKVRMDYGDPRQKAIIDSVIASTPVSTPFALTLGVKTDTSPFVGQFSGPVLLSNLTITSALGQLVDLSGTFSGSTAPFLDWQTS